MKGYPEEISERMNEEAERFERIREQVPEEEFDPSAAAMLAHQEIGPFLGNGK